jgi:hypothetical protein
MDDFFIFVCILTSNIQIKTSNKFQQNSARTMEFPGEMLNATEQNETDTQSYLY